MSEPAAWRCFHCDEVFTDWGAARNHFGFTPEDGAPVCRVEGGTAAEIYRLRRQLELYRREDTPLHREIASLRADHATALRREEERGYERGLRDGRKLELNDDLRLILGRPNFLCGTIAAILRAGGRTIPRKAEFEQAEVIHWTLQLYMQHGAGWTKAAEDELRAIGARAPLRSDDD